MQETIRVATTAADFGAFARLVADYVAWCRHRYDAHPAFVDRVFGHQSLASELAALPLVYAPPQGKTLLALQDGAVCAAIAYRRLDDHCCEMKRLFVSAQAAGRGLGRRLCAALIKAARDDGYARMQLDTCDLMVEAIGLYTSLGFRPCAPYRTYPPELVRHLVFMALELAPDALDAEPG